MIETNEPRPSVETALDVRSYSHIDGAGPERIVLITGDSDKSYPDTWIPYHIDHLSDALSVVDEYSVVIIDRVNVSDGGLGLIASRGPRLVGFVPSDVSAEKMIRRTMVALFPFSELWTFPTSFGRLLVTPGIAGRTLQQWLPENTEL